MTLSDIIGSELDVAGYNLEKLPNDSYLYAKHAMDKEEKDLWIVYAGKFELDDQEKLFNEIKGITTLLFDNICIEEYEKNLSLIWLCSDYREDQAEELWSRAEDIENDPYFFKKYAVLFNPDLEYKLIHLYKQSQKEHPDRQTSVLARLLLDTENFAQLEEEGSIYGVYHLLYSLGHKLPFVKLAPYQADIVERTRLDQQDRGVLDLIHQTAKEFPAEDQLEDFGQSLLKGYVALDSDDVQTLPMVEKNQ